MIQSSKKLSSSAHLFNALPRPALLFLVTLLAVIALFKPAYADSELTNNQLDESGLVFLSATSTQLWDGSCTASNCTVDQPCRYITGAPINVTDSSCILVFTGVDYSSKELLVNAISPSTHVSVAFANGASGVSITISGSSTVNFTSYPIDNGNTASISGCELSTIDAMKINVLQLSATDSSFLVSDSDSNTPLDNVLIAVESSSFSLSSSGLVNPAIFNMTLTANPATRTASVLFKNTTATNSAKNNVYLYHSPSVNLGFLSIQQSSISGFKTIAHIQSASPAAIVAIGSTLTDIGSLSTSASASSSLSLELSSTTITRSDFDEDDDTFTILTDSTSTINIQDCTFRYVSIFCHNAAPLHFNEATASISISDSSFVDSDFCLIGTPGESQEELISISSVSIRFSRDSKDYEHAPNVTLANVNILANWFNLTTDVANSTPFSIRGKVNMLPSSALVSNGLDLARDAVLTVPWLGLYGTISIRNGAILTADVSNMNSNIWNISAPLRILPKDGPIGSIDLSHVRLNIAAYPSSEFLLDSPRMNITSANGPVELMTRMRIQWLGHEAPKATRMYKLGYFQWPNVVTPQVAYASGPISYLEVDTHHFMGSIRPYRSERWTDFIFEFALPQACVAPGPSFFSSNTSASGFACNNATGQWVYNGTLTTESDDILIPCSNCEVMVLGNFTFAKNGLFFRGVRSELHTAEYVTVAAGSKAKLDFSYTYDQAPKSEWDTDVIQPGFPSPDLKKIQTSLNNINRGCKYLKMESEVDDGVLEVEFERKNECIIPIAVGVSLGVAALIVIVLILTCCFCCKEKRTGYDNIE